MTFCQLHTFLTFVYPGLQIRPKTGNTASIRRFWCLHDFTSHIFRFEMVKYWSVRVWTAPDQFEIERLSKTASIFIQKLSISMKSVVNAKASIIEKSSSPLYRLLRSRVLRRTRGSITLRKILTPKSHRQRYKKKVLLLCDDFVALVVVVALGCDTNTYT